MKKTSREIDLKEILGIYLAFEEEEKKENGDPNGRYLDRYALQFLIDEYFLFMQVQLMKLYIDARRKGEKNENAI